MAGAFQSGFAMGHGLYQQHLANAERQAQRRRDDERWAMQKEALQLSLDTARDDAARQRSLSTVLAGLRDDVQGIDREATNAALDADFDAADRRALQGEALPPSIGGSAAANEAALTVRRAIDPSSSDHRLRLNRRLIEAAILNRDLPAVRALEGETRSLRQQGFLDQAARMPIDEVMAQAASLNTNASQLPILYTGKTEAGYQFLTTDASGQPARSITLTEPQARQLVAARLMGDAGLGAESMALVAAVNQDIAALIERSNTQSGQLVNSHNDARAKQHRFGHDHASDQRAAERQRIDSETHAETKRKADAAVSLYRQLNPQASTSELEAVRRGVIPVASPAENQRSEAAVRLYQEKNPQASAAELEAVRRGVIGMNLDPSKDKDQPSEVRLAAAFVRAGLATNMAEGLRMATTAKAESPERIRAEIFGKALAANMGNAQRAQEATEAAMRYLYPSMQSPATSGAATNATRPAASPGPLAPPAVPAPTVPPVTAPAPAPTPAAQRPAAAAPRPSASASGTAAPATPAPSPPQTPASTPGARLQNVRPEDITATAKKYGISEEEVRRRLGL